MNKSEVISALQELGQKPKKGLGQNFLIDNNILEKIVVASEIKKGDRIMEIGPGLGMLTNALILSGSSVTYIEKDKILAQRLSMEKLKGTEGVCADAAKLDYSKVMGRASWKFVSNLPYAITSIALRNALYTKNPPMILVALIQKEVADRIMEPIRSNKVSLLGLMCNLACSKIEIVARVSKNSFFPPPKVESAIIKMWVMDNKVRQKKWGIDGERIMQFAKRGFAHPRKLVQRNLDINNNDWQKAANDLGFKIKSRAEDITIEQWASLTKLFQKK